MRNLSLRFIVALVTFCLGVILASVWLINRFSQPQPAKSESPAESEIPADLLITFQRTGCYGQCPSYTLTIDSGGSVVFHASSYWVRKEGVGFRKESGVVLSKISSGQVRQLISEFEKANYFSLRDDYTEKGDCPSGATDMPYAYTSIQINGRRKAVSHYYGCFYKGEGFKVYPRELTELEKRIDEIVNTEQWMQ
jgi:hypothetical protein